MRTKLSEKYQEEREEICKKLIDILMLDDTNSFLLCELDDDAEKQPGKERPMHGLGRGGDEGVDVSDLALQRQHGGGNHNHNGNQRRRGGR